MLESKDQHLPVLFHKNKSFSVSDILYNATNIAKNLKAKGFKEGDKAVMLAEPNLDFISTLYAIIMCKGIAAIIDPEMGNSLYLNRLKQFKPQWLFIDYRLVIIQKFGWIRAIYKMIKSNAFYIPLIDNVQYVILGSNLKFRRSLNLNKLKSETNIPVKWEQSGLKRDFLVTYTSGTLAKPKGVVHSDYSLVNSLQLLAKKISKYKGKNMVSYLPHFALIGIMANVKVYLWKKELKVSKKISFLKKNDINIFFGPPVEINELIEYCKIHKIPFPPSLKYILLGSAPIYVPFLKKIQKLTKAEVECLYGMTENLLVSYISAENKLAYKGTGDIVGTPFEGVKVKISDEGEIMLKSNQLFSNYLYQNNEFDYHPTGDLGFLDKQGRIVLKGRKKNMIIRKEYNIYPGLYEPIINSIPQIEQAVMVGKYNHSKADEDIYLIVQKKSDITESQLYKMLKSDKYGIDISALPDFIVFSEIPRKGRQQKIDYSELNKIIA